jgi:hypothetical protein
MAAGTLKEVLAMRVAVTVTVSSVSGPGGASAATALAAKTSEAVAADRRFQASVTFNTGKIAVDFEGMLS